MKNLNPDQVAGQALLQAWALGSSQLQDRAQRLAEAIEAHRLVGLESDGGLYYEVLRQKAGLETLLRQCFQSFFLRRWLVSLEADTVSVSAWRGYVGPLPKEVEAVFDEQIAGAAETFFSCPAGIGGEERRTTWWKNNHQVAEFRSHDHENGGSGEDYRIVLPNHSAAIALWKSLRQLPGVSAEDTPPPRKQRWW